MIKLVRQKNELAYESQSQYMLKKLVADQLLLSPEIVACDYISNIRGFYAFNYKYNIMIREGSKVKWPWGNGYGKGKVVKTFSKAKTLVFEDTTVIRHGRSGNKALLIEQDDNTQVLKLESEVEKQ